MKPSVLLIATSLIAFPCYGAFQLPFGSEIWKLSVLNSTNWPILSHGFTFISTEPKSSTPSAESLQQRARTAVEKIKNLSLDLDDLGSKISKYRHDLEQSFKSIPLPPTVQEASAWSSSCPSWPFLWRLCPKDVKNEYKQKQRSQIPTKNDIAVPLSFKQFMTNSLDLSTHKKLMSKVTSKKTLEEICRSFVDRQKQQSDVPDNNEVLLDSYKRCMRNSSRIDHLGLKTAQNEAKSEDTEHERFCFKLVQQVVQQMIQHISSWIERDNILVVLIFFGSNLIFHLGSLLFFESIFWVREHAPQARESILALVEDSNCQERILRELETFATEIGKLVIELIEYIYSPPFRLDIIISNEINGNNVIGLQARLRAAFTTLVVSLIKPLVLPPLALVGIHPRWLKGLSDWRQSWNEAFHHALKALPTPKLGPIAVWMSGIKDYSVDLTTVRSLPARLKQLWPLRTTLKKKDISDDHSSKSLSIMEVTEAHTSNDIGPSASPLAPSKLPTKLLIDETGNTDCNRPDTDWECVSEVSSSDEQECMSLST